MMALAEPLAFYRERNLVLNVASTLLARARMAERVQETESALSDLREGIDLFERSWRAFRRQDDGLRRAFLTKASILYEEALAIESERSCEQALAMAERSRALLTGEPGGLDLSWIEAPARQPVHLGSDAGRCALTAPLPDRVVVLELSIARDQILLWTLRRDGTDFVRQPIARKELARNIERFRQSVRSAPDRLEKTSKVLWNLLLRPVARSIPDGATLVIVPGPEFAHLPFAALRNPITGRYLVEDHEIQLAPSASFYLRKRQRAKAARPGDVLVVQAGFDRESHPELPVLREAQAEAAGVAALYPAARVILEREATRAKVLAELDQHRIVHFLGHGLADPHDPSQSLLLVTPEAGRPGSGKIAAADLMGRPFRNLELVVLAACQSAGTRQPQGAGLFGVARPFLAEGVPAVVGSLLTVPDDATKELMLAFHHQLRAGLPPAAALRQAQLQMLRSARPELREPPGWAGFAVVGGQPLN
jgi:CHAT domain-containing protein